MKSKIFTVLDYVLDGLMFVVPVLEMTEITALIPAEWLPVYMLVSVGGRRAIRILQNILNK